MIKSKAALITGAGSGIGQALALEAAARGYDLILVGRTISSLHQTRDLIGDKQVTCVVADITSPEGREAIRQSCDQGLDILINNAGTLKVGRVDQLNDDELTRMVQTNLLSPMALTRELLPVLKASKGRIVNVGSVFGDIAYPFFSAYSATKFGLRGFSDALRRELSGQGVGVTYLAPRATKTASTSEFAKLIHPMGMSLDDPRVVAQQSWAAIEAGKKESYPRSMERIFVKIQRVLPALIDRSINALAQNPKVLKAVRSL
jgi:short-subunit dehydrogenase